MRPDDVAILSRSGRNARAASDRQRTARPSERILALLLRMLLTLYLSAVRFASRFSRPRVAANEPCDVLLTLNFHASGWPLALLGPLTMSQRCRRLRIVTTADAPGLDAAEIIQPPSWLRVLVGSTGARLMTFAAVAATSRPQVVGGVHLLFNGLAAALVSRIAGARALYICVGGPSEIIGGGVASENRAFTRLGVPDPVIERLLLRAVGSFDEIVTMGTRAAGYFEACGIRAPIHVVPSGVSDELFQPGAAPRDVDVVLVSRLAPVKRLDLFIQTIRKVADVRPQVRVVIIGKGSERDAAERLAEQLGLTARVTFLGHAPEVATWLARSRIFLLTSDTEGVSISLIESMLAGAVPVVSDVGDLADVVNGGVNGVLVSDRTPEGFARPILELLAATDQWAEMSAAARVAAHRFTPAAIAPRWDAVLAGETA